MQPPYQPSRPVWPCAPHLDAFGRGRRGILSLTATDTAALAANHPQVARRTYAATLDRKDPMARGGREALCGLRSRRRGTAGRANAACSGRRALCYVVARIERGAAAADRATALVTTVMTPDGASLGPPGLARSTLSLCGGGGGGGSGRGEGGREPRRRRRGARRKSTGARSTTRQRCPRFLTRPATPHRPQSSPRCVRRALRRHAPPTMETHPSRARRGACARTHRLKCIPKCFESREGSKGRQMWGKTTRRYRPPAKGWLSYILFLALRCLPKLEHDAASHHGLDACARMRRAAAPGPPGSRCVTNDLDEA